MALYGAMLLVLYLSSTLYHSLDGPTKRVFRKLDHTSIYVLIAGTYTPVCLVLLRGRLGFRGLIFSDDLSMAGARIAGDIRARADAAHQAGCDMLLVCRKREAIESSLEALRSWAGSMRPTAPSRGS